MYQKISTSVVVAMFVVGASIAAGSEKVSLCHVPRQNPVNPVTKCVDQRLVPWHLAHGDSLLPCDYDDGCPGWETVPLYSDDLQNGSFDLFVPEGSGSYAVLDDGGGNLVAGLVGDVALEIHEFADSPRTWENFNLSVAARTSGTGTFSIAFRWNESTGRGYWLDQAAGIWTLRRVTPESDTTLVTSNRVVPVDGWFSLSISVVTIGAEAQVQVHINSAPLLTTVDPTPVPFGGVRFRGTGTGFQVWLDDLEIRGHVPYELTWTQSGGPEGGWLVDIEVDPRDWRVAYAAGYDGGLFKTTDGGTTWKDVGLPNGLWKVRIRTIELAPSNPDVVYIGVETYNVSSLWRSDDGGETWKWTEAGDIIASFPDADQYGDDTWAVGIDWTDPMHVFVGITTKGVWESTDGGVTLERLESGGEVISAIAIDPSNPNHILAGSLDSTTSGVSVLRSTDGGVSWNSSDTGIPTPGPAVTQFLFYPPNPEIVFASTGWAPLYRSIDRGENWTQVSGHQTALVVRYSARESPTLVAFGLDGIRVSTDEGENESWTLISSSGDQGDSYGAAIGTDNPDVIYAVSNDLGLVVSRDFGLTWTPSVSNLKVHPLEAMAVAPSDPNIIYAAGWNGLYRSTDGAETWTFLYPGGSPGYKALAVDPADPDIVYMGGESGLFPALLKSMNGGHTWEDISGDISYPAVNALAIDPSDSSTIYAGTGNNPQGSPLGDGLYKSTNGGLNWNKLPGVPDVGVPAVAIDRTDSSHIAVATMGYGVYVSDDGGGSFFPRNNGIDPEAEGMVYALAMHPTDGDTMYAGTNTHYGQKPLKNSKTALYKTTVGGLEWTELLKSDGSQPDYPFVNLKGGADVIVIHPLEPEKIFAGLHAPGIVFSENGGTDWRYANQGLIPPLTHSYPYRMTVSSDGQFLYVTSCGRSVFRNRITTAE